MRRQLSTTERVLRAALIEFTRLGIEAANISAISQRAGVSIGSIYHHFGNKAGIVRRLHERGLEDHHSKMLEALRRATSARESIQVLVTVFIEWCVENPRWARFIFGARPSVSMVPQSHAADPDAESRLQQLREMLQPHVHSGEIRSLPETLYPAIIHGPAQHRVRAWLAGRAPVPDDLDTHALADAAWRAVRTENRAKKSD